MGSDLRLLNKVKEGQLTRRVYGTDGRSRLIGKMWVLAGARAAIWTDGWISKIIHWILSAAIGAPSPDTTFPCRDQSRGWRSVWRSEAVDTGRAPLRSLKGKTLFRACHQDWQSRSVTSRGDLCVCGGSHGF
jgi:hypothetical protein